MFEAQAVKTPEATALVFGEARLSYGELNVRANQLAHHLIALGVKPDERVAICVERSIEMVIGLLGILKAGGAYVPIEPTMPPDRIAYLLADCAPSLILVHGLGCEAMQPHVANHVRVLDLLRDQQQWQSQPDGDPSPERLGLSRNHLAYVIYTSGTTGMPKGVMIEHASATVRASYGVAEYALTPQDRCLQFASFSFDASVLQIFSTLSSGAALIVREQALWSPKELAEQIGRHRITVADVPPIYLEELLTAEAQREMTDLRMLIIGGEATLSVTLCGKPFRQTILNEYGPTEATVSATNFSVSSHGPIAVDTMHLPIGRPIANTRVYLLNPLQQPVPIGAIGEIYIGGDGVARGYLNRPELTAERFLGDPFSDEVGARMYKTGDLGRWLPDGNIEFLGRNDFQVKIRGFRIELGEIEAALAACPGVREAVVLAREDAPGDQRLVGYYLADDALEAAALRENLSTRLPDYMLPAAFVRMQVWPLTLNGKLARKALPAPAGDAYVRRDYEAPQGELETTLAQIWSELLCIGRVGRHDNFFELGGHSLLAARVVSRACQTFDVELVLSDMFDYPELMQLAERLESADSCRLSTIEIASRRTYMPLSLPQQRLWFLSQIDGASAAYNIGVRLRLTGALNIQALKRALQLAVDRHEVLRTKFVLVDGQPMQAMSIDSESKATFHDLSHYDDRERRCDSLALDVFDTPFDLRRGPPLRTQILKLNERNFELQIVMHHIVSDGWSIGVMLNEISQFYSAVIEEQPAPLLLLPIQYLDYAQWQRQWLEEGKLAQQSAYWQRALEGAPSLLELPTDRLRPARQDFAGDALSVRLDAALASQLKTLSRRYGVTLYMTLLAGWAVVLGRLSNQSDVVIGTPVAGRNRVEVESLIGFFVNTLALRINLGDDPSVGELLALTKRQVLEAQAHQDLPFDQVVEAVKPLRSTAHTPIFQVMLSWQNHDEDRLKIPGVQVATVPLAITTAQFDLVLELRETDAGIEGALNYATALFNRDTAARYIGYWKRMLRAMAADAKQPVARLPMLGDKELELVLSTWNDTKYDYPLDMCVHQLFERQAARTPDAVALIYGRVSLTYAELDRRSNRLAHDLRALGVGRDNLVAVLLERGIDMVVTLLGILKAGGAYVPMAPDAPVERVSFMLDDAKPTLLLADSSVVLPADIDVPVVMLEALRSELGHQQQICPDSRRQSSSQLAYVIYTSGTTGTPKGVSVSHRNVVNFCYWCAEACALGAGDRVTQFAPYTFDASAGEIFGGLLAGAELHLLDEATIHDPAALQRYLTTHAIQFSAFPPAYLQQMDPDAAPAGFKLLTAGSAPTPALVKRWAGRGHYLNGYGPTETTILSTSTWLSAEADTITIGRPIANTQVYLLDAQRQPVPIGTVGELYIGGAGVACGYLHRPELTAEFFQDDPFSTEVEARMYKTGDLGRWMVDGSIEFLGRNDSQVKIRGFRIELGEIEARLCVLEGIREAVVVARADGPGEKQLIAYCIADGVLDASLLREQLSKHLPEYMLPSAFVGMNVWPLTANGKLDRKALPAPDDAAHARREYQAPEGEIERALSVIWSELLGIERVGRHDNFFELGGHSLLVISVVEAMRRQGLRADIATLLTAPTLATLAVHVSRESQSIEIPPNCISQDATCITPEMLPLLSFSQAEIDTIVAVTDGGIGNLQDIYPLSPLQEGMLFHYMLAENGDIYLLASLLAFTDRQRLDSFLSAMQRVIDRHDILRTGMVWEGLSMPVQVVCRQVALPVEEVTLDPAEGEIAQQLETRYGPRYCRVDLRNAPLIRLYVAYDAPHQRWLVRMLAHHIVMDHVGYDLMLDDVRAIERGQVDTLPPSIPYRNFVAQARLDSGQARHEEFFRNMLLDVTEPTAPFGILKTHGGDAALSTANRILDASLSVAIRRNCRRIGISGGSFMHLAWALVLARTTGRAAIVFGTVLFGRMRAGAHADRALGLFINTLPVRIDVDETDVEMGLKRVHATLAQLMHHEHASLALAQRCSGIVEQAPLFTSLMNYRYSEQHGPYGADSGIELVIERESERTNYAIDLSVDDFGDDFGIEVSARHGIDADRLCGYMHGALSGLVDALGHRSAVAMSAINVLPQAETDLIVRQWNDTAHDYPRDRCVHGLFEAQAARTPEATALVFGEEAVSYGELNRRANRLAHHLRTLGVVPDDRVAICVERSIEMVVGLLGVLKAGGAYVPLDPTYPVERLQYMLSDSAPVALLTQGVLYDRLSMLKATVVPVVVLDDEFPPPQDAQNPVVHDLTSRHLAYVIYTSGSTGQPKGVAIEHVNASNFIAWSQENFTAEQMSRTLFSTSINFDLAVFELFVPLSSGATVTLVQDILEVESTTVVSLINTVPSAMTALIDAGHIPCSARIVNLAGEPLKRTLTERIFASTQAEAVCNLYGPTETTTYSTWVRMDRAQGFPAHIGRPIANTRIYILDAQRRPAPIGVIGEIHIAGDGVARGYLHRPELTAERFLDDPFCADPGARMYKTGDLGRWLADGNIEYLGRNDFQVKIRGFRIELGEIETKLSACTGVREAVVIAREDTPGDKRLVAYMTLLAGAEQAIPVWRAELSSQLQDYMVPSVFVVLAALPMTLNGKLDRNALPALEADAYSRNAYEAPEGEIEQAVAAIWGELLRHDRVGRNDNFFELGGNSLIAITMISRIRKHGLHADMRSLFSTPELMRFASSMNNNKSQDFAPPNCIPAHADRITPEMLTLVSLNQSEIDIIAGQIEGDACNIQEIYPLSALQEGILFHRLLDQNDDIYLLLGMLRFTDRRRIDSFLLTLQHVVDRHDILRTSFVWDNLNEPMQVVQKRAAIFHEELSLDFSEGPIKSQIEAHYAPTKFRMNLTRAPLFRCAYAHDSESGRWLLCVAFHHLIMDHASLELIKEEAWLIEQGRELELPAPASFRNYIWKAKSSADLLAYDTYFTRMLIGIEQTTAPFGLMNANGGYGRLSEMTMVIPADVSAQIRCAARGVGVSAATIMHLAWALVLRRATGMESVVFGTLLFGRVDGGVDSDRTMGVFINTLPIRIDIQAFGIFELIRKTHFALSELLRYEHASLALAQRCSSVPASMPLFTSLLNYRHSSGPNSFSDGIDIEGVEGGERTNYPLAIAIDDLGDDFGISVQTMPSVGAQRICDFMLATLIGILAALKKGPDTPVFDIDVLPPEERRQVLFNWNRTQCDYPLDQSVSGLFETQAEQVPEAMALVFGERCIRYGELNARANQLAHVLRTLGVGRDALVALVFERGIEMVVALLGVLKAGGAYVPLAPDAPAERLAFMLSDAKPLLLLTDVATRIDDAAIGIPVISLDTLGPRLAQSPQTNPASDGHASSRLAYVIYTSGTTGTPKGVLVSQRSLINFCYWCQDAGLFKAGERMTQFAPYTFDASAGEIFGGLLAGAELHLLDDATIQDPAALQRYLTTHAIHFSAFPPAYLQQMDPDAAQPGFRLLTAGSAPTPALVKRWAGRGHYLNGYGPTETTILSTSTWLSAEAGTITIGRPIANTQVYLLDAHRQPVPIGVVGEIHIGGAGVALGYLNRPELTAELFLEDPFSAEADARMYRTGDLGRWMADGTIEFLGRNDFQVKIRGFRIELGEIEAKLCALAGIREAVAIAREDGPGEPQLVAYYLGDQDLAAESLREQLSKQLPEYMLPSAFVRLETWPLTINGKLDRNALPAPDDAAYARRVYAAPEGEIEQALARIWSELLRIERVGRYDDFFELGGHSLLAIKLVHRIKIDIGHEISVADVFDATTPTRMAERIVQGRPATRAVDASSEAVLADDIRLLHANACPSSSPRGILLTGATGFIGRFLLRNILDTTEAKIYCLVRSDSQLKAFARIREKMIKANLWKEEDALRIVACPGDLALPRLGLSPADYARICDDVDSIYHNGTSMNHLESYASAKRANVDGVQELLRVATQRKAKTFNYVSTLDVFANFKSQSEPEKIDEKSSIDQELHHERDGYATSKWVGEMLVNIAKSRGVSCNIFRLGLVVGDRRHGRYDEKQRLHRMMTSALLMKTGFADDSRTQYLLPVDYVAEAMVGLSMKYPQGGGIFHLVSTSPVSMDDIFTASTAALGGSLRIVSAVEWLRQVGSLHEAGTTLPIMPLFSDHIRLAQQPAPVFNESVDFAHLFDCTCTQDELAALGIYSPRMEMELLALYWRAIRDDAETGGWPDRLIGQEKMSRERRADQVQARGVVIEDS
ncbi:MAG: amino acid adenylation domain-containing protein [Lysobacteraceae bacterium]